MDNRLQEIRYRRKQNLRYQRELAAELAPEGIVDIIIGGHTHTDLKEPCVVEGIPIVQASVGTKQIGRFDILFDEIHNRVDSYTWESIPITEERCPNDEALEEYLASTDFSKLDTEPRLVIHTGK